MEQQTKGQPESKCTQFCGSVLYVYEWNGAHVLSALSNQTSAVNDLGALHAKAEFEWMDIISTWLGLY